MTNSLDFERLKSELADAGSPWEIDEKNPVAQLSDEEQINLLGFTPPPGTPTLEEAVAMDLAAAPVTSDIIASESGFGAPPSYDHRNVNGRNYTTSVKNQGSCGSCVAFGVSAVLETTYKRRTNNASLDLNLSEAHLFYCHAAEEGRNCSNGWWPENALDKIKEKGITLESVYPYTGSQQSCAVPSGWQNNMARVTGKTKLNGRAAIKNWISTRGSVTGCFIVYQDFYSYRSGVYRHVTGDARGGHCVEIIGYNDAQGCWICKNSWGSNWGEGGFFRIAYGQCRIEDWAGPYGANSVSLRQWVNDLQVNGLWTNDSENNAYIHFQGQGWRKVATTNDTVQHAMLSELIGAKAGSRKVNALIDGNVIQETYII